MATRHLTSTGQHLVALDKDDAAHLVVVRQTAAWNNRELVVTPTEKKYVWASAWGKEAHPTTQGGAYVLDDTNDLISDANAWIASAAWNTGNKAIFAYYVRAYSPRMVYQGASNASAYSEYAASCVALKFNLKALHLPKFTDCHVYVRAYHPSLVCANPDIATTEGICVDGGMYNSASTFRLAFFDALPENCASLAAADAATFELAGNCNNGLVVSQDTICDAYKYDAYGQYEHDSTQCAYVQPRIYTPEYDSPTEFYHDFEITGTQLDYLYSGVTTFWALCRFTGGNAFSEGIMYHGLNVARSATAYISRIELVVKCTGGAFNV